MIGEKWRVIKMSHFYGYLQGNRGEATRCGTKDSGINAHIRSWNNDVKAWLYDDDGKDVLDISIPAGLKTYINSHELITFCIEKVCRHFKIDRQKLEDMIATCKI